MPMQRYELLELLEGNARQAGGVRIKKVGKFNGGKPAASADFCVSGSHGGNSQLCQDNLAAALS